MKRAHRKVHSLIWLTLPILLLVILWIAFSIHGGGS